MKTEAQIRQLLADLEYILASGVRDPVNRFILADQIGVLKWALGIDDFIGNHFNQVLGIIEREQKKEKAARN